MKTEQEQIEAIYNLIISHLFEDTVYSLAEQIYEAGYGDVSEYEAEIERLKEENEKMRKERGYINQLKEELLLKHYHVDCYQKEIIKQAQIDVLNKLKKYLHTEDFDTPDERWKPESEFCAIIDKLIKEV